MKKCFPKVMVCVLGFCLVTAALAVEVPLKYEKYPDKTKSFYPSGTAVLQKTIKPPNGEWKIPELKSEHPLYALAKLGDKECLFIMDRQNTDDFFYNRLYYDANGNNDLTDDPVIDGALRGSPNDRSVSVNFPVVDTTIEVDGKSLPYSFRPALNGYSLKQLEKNGYTKLNVNRYINLYLRINCTYSGEFQINGKSYRVVLGDRNCNGRFNDKLTLPDYSKFAQANRRIRIYPQGDIFFITGSEKIDMFDEQTLGDWLLVNNKLYSVNINTAEGKMTLTPVTEKLVPLKLAMKTERISLCMEDNKQSMMIYQPGKEIRIPQGKYRFLAYEAFKKDDQGDLWRLCAAATLKSPIVTVDGSSKSVLEFGEPYMPIVDVRRIGEKSSNRASLAFNVEGKGKEFLTDLSHISGDKTKIQLSEEEGLEHRPKAPTYKIVKADGEVVKQGSFEYG